MAIIVPIASTFNDKGVKDATKQLGGLDKTVKTLAKSFVGIFGAQKVAAFFTASVKGAMADNKAQIQLAKSIRNTTDATSFQIAGVEDFIRTTQFSTGILDDNLRPALNSLVLATGDVTQSQKLLNLALDISSGTGRDLESVTLALAKASGGQFTALQRLGVGLSKSVLETKDLDTITGALANKFSGQAAAAAQTFAGQMSILNVKAQEAQETIGFALIEAIERFGGPGGGASKFGDSLIFVAEQLGLIIIGTAELTSRMYDLGTSFVETAKKAGLLPKGFGLADIIPLIPILGSYITITRKTGQEVSELADINKLSGDRYQLMAEKLYGFKSATDSAIPSIEKATKATKGLSDAQKAVINANIKLQESVVNNLQDSLSSAESSLNSVTGKFNDLRDAISGSVTDVVDFGTAIETENFLQAITAQADSAKTFAEKVKQLIVLGLSERGIRELLDSGFEAGSLIADQLIAGGTTIVNQVNTLLASVDAVAEAVGTLGAQTFYQQGVTQGEALVAGIKFALESAKIELDKLRESLTAPVITPQADVVKKTTTKLGQGNATIRTVLPPDTSGFGLSRFSRLAKGGIAMGATKALIGEAGPEAVIPLSGANSAKMGNTFNIVVNAGIGTSGSQVGKEIVDAIKKFEKTSGPVFASA